MPSGRRHDPEDRCYAQSRFRTDLKQFLYQDTTTSDSAVKVSAGHGQDHTTNVSRASATERKECPSNEVAQDEDSKGQRSLVVTLRVSYYLFSFTQLKRLGIRTAGKASKFRLGHNPWQGLGFPKPTAETVREVHRRLSDYHEHLSFGSFVNARGCSGPVVTVDKVIQVMLAQNAGNENAIDTHSRLCNTYTYVVNGDKYAGKTPNWHEIRHLPIEELQRALEPTGYYQKRAASIMAILEVVHRENTVRKAHGLQTYQYDDNPPDARDFVDGMLSMAYITDDADNSTVAVLDRLLALPNIGPKSAMCIAAFQLKRPLFVVDTHILRYTKWLGWIPQTCNDNNIAAMYLHDIIPEDIRYDLHNQIWTHCAKENSSGSRGRRVICPFCGSIPPSRAKLELFGDTTCPVAGFLPPLSQRWPKRAWQEVEVIKKSVPMVLQAVRHQLRHGNTNTLKHFSTASKSSDTTRRAIDLASLRRRELKYLRTMAFSDLTVDQAGSQGYLLWMFRPLDNSFGEEWGTFEELPRFKWERPTVMDAEVAVSYKYALDVLEGRVQHPWSKISNAKEQF